MKKKKFIIGLSIIAVITLYFAYHRFETSIPVEIDAPYGITCTINPPAQRTVLSFSIKTPKPTEDGTCSDVAK